MVSKPNITLITNCEIKNRISISRNRSVNSVFTLKYLPMLLILFVDAYLSQPLLSLVFTNFVIWHENRNMQTEPFTNLISTDCERMLLFVNQKARSDLWHSQYILFRLLRTHPFIVALCGDKFLEIQSMISLSRAHNVFRHYSMPYDKQDNTGILLLGHVM